MKTLLTALFTGLCIKTSTAQEFNYYYGDVKLVEKEAGVYEDEFGKCYESSVLLKSYDKLSAYRNRYSNEGIETTVVQIGNFEIEIAEKQSGWVKKKMNGNCLSPDPNDCLVWCAVNTPKRVVEVRVIDEDELIDVSVLDEEYRGLLLDSGYMIYSETNCEIDNAVLDKLLLELNEYFSESIEIGELNLFLSQYQYENNLPIGGLNLETLYELEVL